MAVAGPQYPEGVAWPANVKRIEHVPPHRHRAFYNAQSFALNLTRADMVRAGYSPSVRLFEATACGVPILTDAWEGLGEFFEPGREILVVRTAEDVVACLTERPERLRRRIGDRARVRSMAEHTAGHRARRRATAEHTAGHRARTLEAYVRELIGRGIPAVAMSGPRSGDETWICEPEPGNPGPMATWNASEYLAAAGLPWRPSLGAKIGGKPPR